MRAQVANDVQVRQGTSQTDLLDHGALGGGDGGREGGRVRLGVIEGRGKEGACDGGDGGGGRV